MKFRFDTILAAFIVALFASFLTALAVLLVKALSTIIIRDGKIVDLIVNLLILFFFAGFVFFKGSSFAAWLVYRHDTTWGYKVDLRQIMPIYLMSLGMAVSVFFAVYFFVTNDLPSLANLEHVRSIV